MNDEKELGEYIDTLLKSIDVGLRNNDKFYIAPQDKITVELATVNRKKAEGGIKTFVLNADRKYNND